MTGLPWPFPWWQRTADLQLAVYLWLESRAEITNVFYRIDSGSHGIIVLDDAANSTAAELRQLFWSGAFSVVAEDNSIAPGYVARVTSRDDKRVVSHGFCAAAAERVLVSLSVFVMCSAQGKRGRRWGVGGVGGGKEKVKREARSGDRACEHESLRMKNRNFSSNRLSLSRRNHDRPRRASRPHYT